jgi:PAS domain S-box-containing protein
MSLRAFLIRLIVLSVLPLMLLSVYLAGRQVIAMQSLHAEEANNLAKNVANAIDHQLRARIDALGLLAASPLADDPARLGEFYLEAQRFRKTFDSHVVFADLSMQMLFNTRIAMGAPLPKLPKPGGHAAAPEVLRTGRPSVGDVFPGPIAAEPLVAMVVPVARDGQTRYLLLCAVETRQFQRYLDQMALPPGWILTLHDSKGEVIAHSAPQKEVARSKEGIAGGCFITAPSAVSRWSVALEIPFAIYRRQLFVAAAALLAAILLATLISVWGGRAAARRLSRAVQSLVEEKTPPPREEMSYIVEIETVRRMLAEAGARQAAAEATRNHAQESMRTAHARLRRLVDANIFGVAIATPSGGVIEANDYYLETIGYTREEFERGVVDWRAITPPEWISADERAIAELRERGTCTPYEKEYLRRDGTRVTVFLSDAMLPGPEEQIAALVLDITERKRAEQALRRSEANLRKSQETAKLGSWIYGPADRLSWSDEMYRLFGVAPTFDLTVASFIDLIHPDDREAMRAWIAACEAGEKPGELEFRTLTPSGAVRYICGNGELFYDATGKPLYMSGTAQDITERKLAEQALQDSEHKFRMIIENSRDVIFTLDADGHFLFISPAIHYLVGHEPSALIGHPFQAIVHPDHAEACVQAMRRIIEKGTPSPGFEYRVRHVDGQYRWHTANGAAVHDAAGNLIHFQGVARDITERRKLEEQLRQSQKMESVGRLAGGVAHDYNNMLSVILGYTEIALSKTAADDPLHADLQEIQHAATRSADITRQLLAFARRQTIAPEVLDLNADVEKLLKMLRRLIGEDIDLAWLPGAGLWSVRMDPSQLNQVLANLCVNARDAIADVGKITIETRNVRFDEAYCANHPGFSPGNFVQLAVSDNGSGMDKEIQAHLFEPFFTTKGIGRGTGLGLATVYGIVKQNEGFINVYSEPGKGSTFRIYLPRHAGPAAEAPKATDSHTPKGRGETVLVVEDEEAILKLTKKILERLGYLVLAAGTPAEAIEISGQPGIHIHLLITDVVMPGMNGRELADRLRQMHPGLKYLFMSGYTANAIAHHGVLDSGVLFIQKPFSASDLARKVRQSLD